jgi:hypothetical protein
MVGMALAKSMYAIPTWRRTVALVSQHVALRGQSGHRPERLRLLPLRSEAEAVKPVLDACLDRLTAWLHATLPGLRLDALCLSGN